MRRNICWAEVGNHIQKRVPGCLMLRNHSVIVIIFSPIDFRKRLCRRDIDERFYLSTAQNKVKNSTNSSMRWVGTTRYDYTDSFGKLQHGSTLVLSRISCITSSLALPEDEHKFKLGDVLALIKHQFHAPTCQVNVWNNHVFTLSTNLVPQF
jgi:hypothetical protein